MGKNTQLPLILNFPLHIWKFPQQFFDVPVVIERHTLSTQMKWMDKGVCLENVRQQCSDVLLFYNF